jgi:hypothetical protein
VPRKIFEPKIEEVTWAGKRPLMTSKEVRWEWHMAHTREKRNACRVVGEEI